MCIKSVRAARAVFAKIAGGTGVRGGSKRIIGTSGYLMAVAISNNHKNLIFRKTFINDTIRIGNLTYI
jgi:hypothetical protein